jgi:hypothetical protein
MFELPKLSGEPPWRQMMELESRKEVIEGWLSSSNIPAQLVEVLKEMLATTEHQLQAVRSQGLDSTTSCPRIPCSGP